MASALVTVHDYHYCGSKIKMIREKEIASSCRKTDAREEYRDFAYVVLLCCINLTARILFLTSYNARNNNFLLLATVQEEAQVLMQKFFLVKKIFNVGIYIYIHTSSQKLMESRKCIITNFIDGIFLIRWREYNYFRECV